MTKHLTGILIGLAFVAMLVVTSGYRPIDPSVVEGRLAINPYLDSGAYATTVSASSSIATVTGTAFPSTTVGMTLLNYSTTNRLFVQVDGTAADATSFYMPKATFRFWAGSKTHLDNFRLFGTANRIGVIYHTMK